MHGTAAGTARKDDFIRISFQLDPELHKRFRDIASAEHRTVSAELRRLMERRIAEAEQAGAAA